MRIRELLEDREFVDLETLCRELGASESSVRRDLVQLEKTGVIKRVHGGALAVQPRGHLLDYNWQRDRQSDEKRRIGERAASLIDDDQTVILDGGSTVAAVAERLVDRSLRVITNSIPIVRILQGFPQHRPDAHRRLRLPAPGDRARAALRAHARRRWRPTCWSWASAG